MERILIIKLSAFGDIVQAEGAIHDIRNHHPDAEIILMTTPPFRELMEKCPWIDSVFVDFRESRWRLDRMAHLSRRLKKLAADMVYDLQQVGRTAFYNRLLFNSVPWVVGGSGKVTHSDGELNNKGAMDRFAIQLTKAGVRVQHTLAPDLSWMAQDVSHILADKKIRKPYVVLIPGSSAEHGAKRWPCYNELADWLRSRGKIPVTVPGPAELELCRSLTHATILTDGKPYLSLFELAGILKQAEFVIGNDTGPTHLAAHMGKPGLALFSGHFSPLLTGIQYSRFAWIEEEKLGDLSLEKVQQKVKECLAGLNPV